MSNTVTFEDRDQFVYCRYTGPFQLDPLVDLAKKVNDRCITEGYIGSLVDITESFGAMGEYERFKHATLISEFMNITLKIAILGRKGQVLTNLFWENTTRNRMLKTKVFTDLKMAEKWLQS